MREFFSVYLPALLFVGTCALLYFYPAPMEYFTSHMYGHEFLSYLLFTLLLAAATIFAPITAMPLIPMVSPIFGPFLTSVLSIIGWTLGAAVAFGISRVFGRPLLSYVLSLDRLDAAVGRIPPEMRFATMVLVRMTLPVDIMSYAMGLVRSIAFVPYLIATVIGVSWFSFLFSYMGSAFFAHRAGIVVLLGVVALVLFLGCWAILIRHIRRHQEPPHE